MTIALLIALTASIAQNPVGPPPGPPVDQPMGPPMGQPMGGPPMGGPPMGGEFNPRGPGIEVHIPSTVAGTEGLIVQIIPPPDPRYPEGAPVVISVAGGFGPEGLGPGRPPMSPLGFIEIHFNFPGGGPPPARSGGQYDQRGRNSCRALADVILFAQGKLKTTDGQTIGGICGPARPLASNVGLLGSSNGGNQCVIAASLFGKEFPELAFYASMESPLGEGAVSAECGSRETGPNPAYDPDTGKMDYAKLAYDPNAPLRSFRQPMGGPPMRGVLYFDMNGNGRLDQQTDFLLSPVVFDVGEGRKAWYSLGVLRAAVDRKLFGNTWPAHIPTVEEATKFWEERDGALHTEGAVKNCPNLMVIVYANELDHVQAAADHPHILAQYEGFRKAGARFIRLNPDSAYVEAVFGLMATKVRDNAAGEAFDHKSIRQALEPQTISRDQRWMAACVIELADRVQKADASPNLDAALFPDAPNRLPSMMDLPPEPPGPPGEPGQPGPQPPQW